MLVHLAHAIKNFEARHVWHLVFFGGKVPYEAMLTLTYLVLPALIAAHSDTIIAGMVKSAVLFAAAFFFAPLAGNLADRWGALVNMRIAAGITIVVAMLWLVLPLSTLSLAVVLLLFYLRARFNNTDTYLLRTTEKEDGGLIFGLSDNLSALANFIAMIAMPVFLIVGRETWSAVVMLVTGAWYLILTCMLPRDVFTPSEKKCGALALFNPITTVRHGWHFIRTNHYYPLIRLSYVMYHSVLKGALWFIIPIHLAATHAAGWASSLPLGIYELVATLFAGAAGYLADHLGWQRIHRAGWVAITIGAVLLPCDAQAMWLIGAGAIVAVGNTLAYAASMHALEEQDDDHAEDGSYMATEGVIGNAVEMCMPILVGLTYASFGFQSTLLGLGVVIAMIGCTQLGFVWWHAQHTASTPPALPEIVEA